MKKLAFLKPKGVKKRDTFTLLFLLISSALFFILAFVLSDLVTFLLGILFSLSIAIFADKGEKRKVEKKEELCDFFHAFVFYSAFKRDYISGFKMAVDAMAISEIKDSLKDYLDSGMTSKLELKATNSRLEYTITSTVISLVKREEEYSSLFLSSLNEQIDEFEREDGEEKMSLYFLPSLLLAVYFIFLLFYL